jgi:GNAT superfamily N-acetyltransferase
LAFLDLGTPGLARWNSEEFFVPPGLWGAGIGSQFLGKLLEKLGASSSPVSRAEVTIGPQSLGTSPALERTDVASRQQRNDLIAFYKRAGFQIEKEQLVWTR